MEINFKQIVAILGVLLIAALYFSPEIPEVTGGSLGGSQMIGLVLLGLAVVVFLFGSGNIK